MNKQPCPPDCEGRNAYCHTNCKKWAEYEVKYHAMLKNKWEQKEIDDVVFRGREKMVNIHGKLKQFQRRVK